VRNELEQAIADFDQAIALDPGFAIAYMKRGLALLNQGKATEALRDFEKAQTINPNLKDRITSFIEAAHSSPPKRIAITPN
jgi:tetratricopeptide (TPR) repeat protein